MDPILDTSHPSFGAESVAFQFAIENPRTGTRFIVVEAKNKHAIAVIEKVLLANHQKVASNCRVLCVFRNYTSVGVRDDLIEEIPYIDFVTDIVDPGWLLALGSTVATHFSLSITPEEQKLAVEKAKAINQEAQDEVQDEAQDEVQESSQRDNVVAALVDMGFKKSSVEKFIRSLGPRANSESVQVLLREGIQSLAS